MTTKLRIIIEGVLSHFPDANLSSEAARKTIADEIIQLYSTTDDERVETHIDEIISAYELNKKEAV